MTELIVALDGPIGLETTALVSRLVHEVGVRWFKIGVPALLAHDGRRTVHVVQSYGAAVMMDLKLYDTMDTVLRAVDAAVEMGAAMLTVHADCVPYVVTEGRLKIIAVRRLTDGTAGDSPVAWETKAPGFVCPVSQVKGLRLLTDKIIVTPGIRPAGWPADNHAAAATPAAAAMAGADFIVVGRPIIASYDPVEAAKDILREIHAVPPITP